MSIHKSQGQTLGRVRVDLKGIFQKGQDIPHLPVKHDPSSICPRSSLRSIVQSGVFIRT